MNVVGRVYTTNVSAGKESENTMDFDRCVLDTNGCAIDYFTAL